MDYLQLVKDNPPADPHENYYARLAEFSDRKKQTLKMGVRRACIREFGMPLSVEQLYVKFSSEICKEGDKNSKWQIEDDKATFIGKTRKSLTSIDEALEFFEVDTDKWIVDRYSINSWDVTMKGPDGQPITETNYQVKAWLQMKDRKTKVALENVLKDVQTYIPGRKIKRVAGKGIGVCSIADIHLGAEVKDLVRTPDFDINIITGKMRKVADRINAFGFDKVVLNVLGDLIESFTGLNHPNTFKSLGYKMYGRNLLQLADAILNEHLISRIHNLAEINIVAGNHDRVTISKDVDNEGEFAGMFAYLLKRTIGDQVKINFHSYVIAKEIDGIVHILTHGDRAMNKKDPVKIILDYGDNSKFNILYEGHRHTRAGKKTVKTKPVQYYDIELTLIDELKYRHITVASLFTGNFYSETLGYAGTSGFTIVVNPGMGVPDVYDLHI